MGFCFRRKKTGFGSTFKIIPSQKNMVNAALSNKEPNLQKGIDAKIRSIHNNYITLPVLFIMISSHFPFTYGHKYNWLILALISIIGAAVRHYFNLRNKKEYKVWILPLATVGMICLMLYVSMPKIKQNENISTSNNKISFYEINNIIKYRCGVCHATKPTFEGFEDPRDFGIFIEIPVKSYCKYNRDFAGICENLVIFNRPKTQDKAPHWWKNTPENGNMNDDDS